MFDLPDLDIIRPYTSYTDMFMLTLVWNIAVYGMGVFVLFIILLAITIYNLRKTKRTNKDRQSLLTEDETANRNS